MSAETQAEPEGVISTGGRRYVWVHSRVNEETLAELDEIMAYLASNTEMRRINETPKRPDAVRWAIGVAQAHVRALKKQAEGG